MANTNLKTKQANSYADSLIEGKLSIREVAKIYGVSKTTVHKYLRSYVTGVFRRIKLNKQLSKNKATGFLKGGEVTKQKYLSVE